MASADPASRVHVSLSDRGTRTGRGSLADSASRRHYTATRPAADGHGLATLPVLASAGTSLRKPAGGSTSHGEYSLAVKQSRERRLSAVIDARVRRRQAARERWLAKPRQRAQRAASVLRYHDLAGRAAAQLLVRQYGSVLAGVSAQPAAAVARAGRLVRYEGAYGAVVEGAHGRMLETSSVPLRARDQQGAMQPVGTGTPGDGAGFRAGQSADGGGDRAGLLWRRRGGFERSGITPEGRSVPRFGRGGANPGPAGGAPGPGPPLRAGRHRAQRPGGRPGRPPGADPAPRRDPRGAPARPDRPTRSACTRSWTRWSTTCATWAGTWSRG